MDAGKEKNARASGKVRTSIFKGLDEGKGIFPNFASRDVTPWRLPKEDTSETPQRDVSTSGDNLKSEI